MPQRTIIRTVITKVEALAREVEKLEAFRRSLAEYDWQAWDREIEQDAAARKLDQFAAEALAEFERGETKDI